MSEFEQILGEVSKEYAEAEVYDNWMPPDADYTVALGDFKEGVSDKEGGKSVWMRLKGKILDSSNPELDQKEFTAGYYTSKAIFSLKNDVAVLAGAKIDDIQLSRQVIKDAQGWIVTVRVATRESKKTGREYTSSSIINVIDKNVATTASA